MIWTKPPCGATQNAPIQNAAHIVSCERADDVCMKASRLFFLIGAIAVAGAGAAATTSRLSLAVALASSAIGYLLYAPALVTQARLRRRAARYWRHEAASTVISASWAYFLYTCFAITFASAGLIYSVWLAWRQPTSGFITGASTTGLVTLIFASARSALGKTPLVFSSSTAVILTPDRIVFWPGQNQETRIPWHETPAVEGVHNGALFVTTRRNRAFLVPISHLCPGYAQFGRVIDFYAKHVEFRNELATPEGLSRVRLLMHKTVEQAEQAQQPTSQE